MPSWNDTVIAEFRETGGYVHRFGKRLVLLHHVGARSGVTRVSPVMTFRDGDDWLIAASKAGAPEHPAWYFNLRAHPDIDIEVPGGDLVPVTARELTGAARDEAWARFTAEAPAFGDYQARTERTIPVLRLARRGGSPDGAARADT